jgi:YVTN family beta-propeller protein
MSCLPVVYGKGFALIRIRKLKKTLKVVFFAFVLLFSFSAGAPAGETTDKPEAGPPAAAREQTNSPEASVAKGDESNDSSKSGATAKPVTDRITRQGLVVEFSAKPSAGRSMTGEEIFAADFVDLAFRITDAKTGQPLKGQYPGAWMDYTKTWEGKQSADRSCKDRIGLYLQGAIGIRPLIDLNSYFILVMHRDPSIAVIDPITGITGITKLYAQINLKQPAADWAKTRDEVRLFVTMPRANEIAVVDTETFKVIRNVTAGKEPVRIALQPDQKYLWVGNNAKTASESGVTVIDRDSLAAVKHIPTGRGHHEIAFSDDSLHVFVSNREDGTVSVIETQRLTKVKDIKIGRLPISLAFSSRSKALYVADAEKGEISVIDARTLKELKSISAKPGLGPLRFSQDGRWAVAINSREDVAYVIDPSTNRIAHTLAVGRQPYHVAFSRSFAYVRSLGTERVSMINLSELGKPEAPPVVTFPAGQTAPEKAKEISIADTVVETPGEAAVMVVSPADTTVYYYMEGMNAPMGNFRNYGHMPIAVQVIDRSMKEGEPGVYSSTVRIPEAGTYDVAFLLDSPKIVHCFEMAARPNPMLEYKGPPLAVQYLNENRRVSVGETVQVRFRLTDPRTDKPRADLKDVTITYFAAPGGHREVAPARNAGEGVYEAELPIRSTGTHYVYVACPSEKVKAADLPFMTLMASNKADLQAPRGSIKRSNPVE